MKKLEYIMLVDDDQATNYFHKLIIKESGIGAIVQSFANAEEGLDYLQHSITSEGIYPQPGIIFLDINMPGMTGWDFLEEFNKLPDAYKAQTSIFILSTSENLNDMAKANANQCIKKVLAKPLTVEGMQEIVNAYFSID